MIARVGPHSVEIDPNWVRGMANGVSVPGAGEPCKGNRLGAAQIGSLRHPSPYRSNLEAAYAGYLHGLMLAGDIQFYKFEPLRLILADACTLTPDFLVMQKDGTLEFHEVKGRKREDAMIKLRVAARTFHWWNFILVERRRGFWEQREMQS